MFDFINSNCLDEHNIIFTVAFSNLKYVLICFVFLYYFSDYFDAGIDMLKESLTEITTNAVWIIQEPGISVVKLTEEILKIMESDEAKDYSLILCTQILGILKFHGPSSTKREEMMMNFYKDICVNQESFKNWTDFLSIYIPNHISAHSQFVYQLMINNFLRQSVQFCLPKKDESLDLAKLKLSKEEEATMKYVAGYVAFSIKKSVRRKTTPEAKAVIKVLDRLGCSNDQDIADDSSLKNYTMHWIMQINRGGLFEVNDEFYSFIKLTEHLARIILNKKLLIQYCGHDIRAVLRGGYRIFFKYVKGPKLKIENFPDFRNFPDFPIWCPFISPISCSN